MLNRKRITLGGIILALIVAILFLGVKQSASATGDTEPCVPAEAYTETIEHPAVTEVVHHDAVYDVEHEYLKYVKGKVQQQDNGKGQWHNTGQSFDWEPWVGGSVKWDSEDVAVLEEGPHSAVQAEWTQGRHNWRKLTTRYEYRNTGNTRDGELLEEAYDETVVITEAYTETIDHPAVVCEEPTEEPTTDPEIDDPEIGTAIRSDVKCISPTEIKTTTYVNSGDGWVDEGAVFSPALPRHHCAPDTQGLSDTEAHNAVTKVYVGGEEGM